MFGVVIKPAFFCCYRFETDQFEKFPYFLFGDFNFRLDLHSLLKVKIDMDILFIYFFYTLPVLG